MKKKVLLCLVALCVSTLSPLTVSAATNPAAIRQTLQENSEAYMTGPDGERTELEITSVEVREIPLPAQYRNAYNSDEFTAYAASVKTKTGKASYKKNGIDASSALTMTWVDGPFAENSITKLKGHTSVAKGTFDSAILYWGTTYTAPLWAPYSESIGDAFEVDIDYMSEDDTAGKLRADAISDIVSPTDNKIYQLTVRVVPTILD